MISFKGNRQILKFAQMLESGSRKTYTHISTSRIRKWLGTECTDPKFFTQMKKDYSLAQKMIKESGDSYTSLLYSLQFGRVGNCTEDAMLAELLGRINGQNNIYKGCLKLNRGDKSGYLNHVVAFITDKPVEDGIEQVFKNKDAIIIDPWLGITDFAGSYFTKLKTVYRKIFTEEKNKNFVSFPNDNLAMELIRSEAKTVPEFKAKRKELFTQTSLSIQPFTDSSLNAVKLEDIKETFPELILKNFKKISMPKKKTKTPELDRIA